MDAMVAQEDDVFEAMKDVVDPELGINVVDLGLVYGVSVEEGNIATIDMTLTSAADNCHSPIPAKRSVSRPPRVSSTGVPRTRRKYSVPIAWDPRLLDSAKKPRR